MPRTLNYYLREGKVNWERLPCVIGEMKRIWRLYLSEATIRTGKESIAAFRNRLSSIMKELDQTCHNFFKSTNMKQTKTERDLKEIQMKEYEATMR